MSQQDIRWIQRLNNFCKALYRLQKAVEIFKKCNVEDTEYADDVGELLKDGMVKRFEYTRELAWKVMKDYAEYQGYTDICGARDAIRKAYEMRIIEDKEWMDSINDINLTSYNYYGDNANKICNNIINVYFPIFKKFEEMMLDISGIHR